MTVKKQPSGVSKQTAGELSDLIANLRQQPAPDSDAATTVSSHPSVSPHPSPPPPSDPVAEMPAADALEEQRHQQGSVTAQNEWSVPRQAALSSSSPRTGASISAGRRPRGRPRQEEHSGKRSDPDYCMAGAYIRKDTRNAVQRILLEQNFSATVKRDYSDLIEDLLQNWIARSRSKPSKD